MFTTRSSPSVGQAASLPCHDRSPSSKIASWPLDIRRVSYLSTGPKPCTQHQFRRVKKLPWKCSGISSYTQARDNARAETKTNHSRRSPAPVRAKSPVQNRSLAPATADCCPPLRQARPRQRSSPNRRPATPARSPTRRVITCTSRRDSERPQEFRRDIPQ